MEGGGEVGLKSGLAFNKFDDNHRKFIFSSQYKYIKPDFSEWARSEPDWPWSANSVTKPDIGSAVRGV